MPSFERFITRRWMSGLALLGAVVVLGILMIQSGAAQSDSFGFAAVPDQKGGQDQTGPYEAVENWPKPLSQLKGHENWTWGAVQGIFAENPNRVFILMRGELPNLKRPEEVPIPNVGPCTE